ncbi:(2Fe-2S)-binding protein [Paraburkholderia sp. LEh10]|nr:(2Fe-2S)-binding protein [Paraburkholderia sp. LEh10]
MPLLWYLRDELDMTGTKYGCGMAMCGACTVHLDGRPVRSCMTSLGRVDKQHVTTIEGVHTTSEGAAVLAAWTELEVAQCGYCQPGQVMTAAALLAHNPRPSDRDIDVAMGGNICRCATYVRIRAAIHLAARKLAGEA